MYHATRIQLLSFHFRLQDFHLLWCIFSMLRLASRFDIAVTTPIGKPIGLGFSPFAHHYLENLWFDFSSSSYLDVSVRGLAHTCLYIQQAVFRVAHSKSPALSLLPTPRSISSVTTSFVASVCLGIHR